MDQTQMEFVIIYFWGVFVIKKIVYKSACFDLFSILSANLSLKMLFNCWKKLQPAWILLNLRNILSHIK